MSIQILLDRLEGVRRSGEGRWIARCPAHQDRDPSLSMREMSDGMILIHCHAGCGAADVMAAVGLGLGDLYPEEAKGHHFGSKLRRNEARAYHESVVEIAANDLKKGQRLTRDDVNTLKAARDWLARNPETLP